MRLSVAVLALSTLAAAGPLPPPSNTTIDLGLLAQAPANFTIDHIDPITTMNNLKAIYDYLNNSNNNNKTDDHSGAVSVSKTGDFWTWLKYTFEGPPSSRSPSATTPLIPRLDVAAPKALYDEDGRKDALGKRNLFWHWVKMTFESPGLGSGT